MFREKAHYIAENRRFSGLAGVGILCLAVLLTLFSSAAAAQPTFKLMSYNIQYGADTNNKRALDGVLKVIVGQKPDLLAVQEIDSKDVPAVTKASGLPHHVHFKAYGTEVWRHTGVAVFYRGPLQIKTFPLDGTVESRFFAEVTLSVQGMPLAFFALHLSREGLVDKKGKGLIKELLGGGSRSAQMESVIRQLKRSKHRFKVLAGDLNTFTMSGPYRQLNEIMEDAFPKLFNEGTYRAKDMPSPKIDHIFHSKGISAVEANVVKEGPSDHYPVTAVLKFDPDDAALSRQVIEAAQLALAARGFIPGSVDGVMEPGTRRAIAQYQAQNGLIIDGTLSEQTRRKLLSFR
jgi:endonuclease/exonuclease/phosphatase family metal-dependent hydrolase